MSTTVVRDERTGLAIVPSRSLAASLPYNVAFQLQLLDHQQDEAALDSGDGGASDLEIFFADSHCGNVGSDGRSTRAVLLTAQAIAVYAHSGVLKHKIDLADLRRAEFFTTADDSCAAVMLVPGGAAAATGPSSGSSGSGGDSTNSPLLPVVISLLRKGDGTVDGANSVSDLPEDMSHSPTTRLAELRSALGGLHRLRCEELAATRAYELMRVFEAAASGQLPPPRSTTTTTAAAAQGEPNPVDPATGVANATAAGADSSPLSPAALALEDEYRRQLAASGGDLGALLPPQLPPARAMAVVVCAVESAARLDILLRSLAPAALSLAMAGTEPAVPPLEVAYVCPPQCTDELYLEDMNLVETVERLCRKEKDLVFDDIREEALENAGAARSASNNINNSNGNNRSSSVASYAHAAPAVEVLVDGFKTWVSAVDRLAAAKHSHATAASDVEAALAALRDKHERRNDTVLRIADESQDVSARHSASLGGVRDEVAAIDGRVREMEALLGAATRAYTDAMKRKDAETHDLRVAVERMRHDLTKGAYSQLPSHHALAAECEALAAAVEATSARAQELHVSAPDRSVLEHLTRQLEGENASLQADILECKSQRRETQQRLVRQRLDLGNADARRAAAQESLRELERRRARCEQRERHLAQHIATAESHVATLRGKLHRLQLEAVVVDDLRREEVMHRSIAQSARIDLRADVVEARKVERLMREQQASLQVAHGSSGGRGGSAGSDGSYYYREAPSFKAADNN